MSASISDIQYPHCPVSGRLSDENAARLVAGMVTALVAVSAVTGAWWPIPIVFFDFLWRGLVTTSPSPLSWLSAAILRALKVSPRPSDAAPKVFAARIGLVFSTAIGGFLVVGQARAALVASLMLIAAAGLQAFAGVCVGCRLYDAWRRATDRS